MLLLPLGAALAAPPALDDVDDEEADDLRYLPTPNQQRDDARVWLGTTLPTVDKPWAANFDGVALGIEANVRVVTSIAWLQPEVRLAYDQAFSGFTGFGGDLQGILTVGPRFGLDHGPYGGFGGGLLLLRDLHYDGEDAGFFGTGTVYGGWAFRGGERMRWGPEVSLGVRNTLALRLEWGA